MALAVLAGALMAVADLSGSALRNFGYARDLSVATLLARGKMAEMEEKYEDTGLHRLRRGRGRQLRRPGTARHALEASS